MRTLALALSTALAAAALIGLTGCVEVKAPETIDVDWDDGYARADSADPEALKDENDRLRKSLKDARKELDKAEDRIEDLRDKLADCEKDRKKMERERDQARRERDRYKDALKD